MIEISDGAGRGSAWGHSMLSMSMPTVPTATTAAASNASSPSLAAGRFKLFKKEKKLSKRPNHRYKNQSSDNIANLLSEQVQNDRTCHSTLDGSPSHSLYSRTPDLFMASVYRQANCVQQHDTTSISSTSDMAHSSPRQLIYSRALMNDKKRASNSNDVIVEDFDQNDVTLNTPVQLGRSFLTLSRNNSMLAF